MALEIPTRDRPPTFNWTDEEKALLRRTLRVRELGEERLEVETCEPGYFQNLPWTLTLVAAGFAMAVSAVLFGTKVAPGGLVVPAWMLTIAGGDIFLTLMAFTNGPAEPSAPVSLFASTPWCIRHRPTQNSLEMLRRTDLDRRLLFVGRPVVPLCTDVGDLYLRTPITAPAAERIRVRKLILDRCALATPEPPALPDRIAALVGKEVALLPREFYVPLGRYLDVVSVTTEMLVVRNGEPRQLPGMLVAAAELVFLMVLPLLLPAFGMWPEHVAVGDARTARLWQLALFVALLLIGPLHMVVYARLVKRHRATTLTLSKRSPYLVVRDRLGERQIPATECLLYAALDPASDGSEFGTATPMAIFLSHKGRPLAQWVLDYRRASDSEAKALSAGMREYLRGGDRPVSRRHE